MHPIVISTGDPAGIGPEVTLKAINALHDHPPIIITIHNETLNDPYYKSYINNFQPFNPSKLSKNCVYYSLIDHDASIIKSHQKIMQSLPINALWTPSISSKKITIRT